MAGQGESRAWVGARRTDRRRDALLPPPAAACTAGARGLTIPLLSPLPLPCSLTPQVLLVQIAVPSRTDVPEYQRLRRWVDEKGDGVDTKGPGPAAADPCSAPGL